jgi:hypothetical protein
MNHQTQNSSNFNDSSSNSYNTVKNNINIHKKEFIFNQKDDSDKLIFKSNSINTSLSEFSSNKKYHKNYGRNQYAEEVLIINNKIKNNDNEINNINIQLINLKQEKKRKKTDIINLLSNKESIEEIYRNQLYIFINKIKNQNSLNIEKEKNFKVELIDIKESDQNKFIEQIINLVNDIFKSKNSDINNSITNIINEQYRLLNENDIDKMNDLFLNNFFANISLYISNQSLGKIQEDEINLLLRYLLKINSINKKLDKYLKFVNKKYKEQKKQLNNSLNDLEKKNKNLNQKKNELEQKIKKVEEIELSVLSKNDLSLNTKLFQGNNKSNKSGKDNNKTIYNKKYISKCNHFSIKSQKNLINSNINNNFVTKVEENQHFENEKNIIKDRNISDSEKREEIKKNLKNESKEEENENQLTHDVIIEYDSGIDQNAEINYEEDDISDQYNYEKENELINKGINPYTNDINNEPNISDIKSNSLVNNQSDKSDKINSNLKNIFDCIDKKDNKENKIDINHNYRNFRKKNENTLYIKENKKEKEDKHALMRKINDYTFNISINNNSKNIFTENNSGNNIELLKDKISKDNHEKISKRNNEIFNLAKKIQYDTSQNDQEKIITYKISSINKYKLQEMSNNIIDKNNLSPENKARIKNRQKEKKISKNNNKDEKNHNYISIINITNNAPAQEKSRNIEDDEKIFNIDNLDNEISDELRIKTMKIKNNVLNKKEKMRKENNIDEYNNDYFLDKDAEEDIEDFQNSKKLNNNTKNMYKIDLTKFLNKNSGLKSINERSLKNNNLNLNIGSFNNSNITPKNSEKNMTEINEIPCSNLSNILTPIKDSKNKEKEKKYISDFFNNLNSNTLKITKTKEINIHEIKNNKLNIFDRKKFSKTIFPKKLSKRKNLFSNSGDKILKKSKNNNNKLRINIEGRKSKYQEDNDNIISQKMKAESFNSINDINKNSKSRKNNSIKLLHQNNLSLDGLEKNKNKIVSKRKLSPINIRKLKMINLPIPKNQIIKNENDKIKQKDSLDKSIKSIPSFYEYVKNQKNLDNKYIRMTKQSICYYRIYNKSNAKINADNDIALNLEEIGFSKGYISIVLKSDILQFIPKINNNNNELSIDLKNIIGVQIEKYMQGIINKFSSQNKNEIKNNQTKDFFIFNLLICDFKEGKIECIFDNFDLFMFWMKFLEQISEYYRNSDILN